MGEFDWCDISRRGMVSYPKHNRQNSQTFPPIFLQVNPTKNKNYKTPKNKS